MQRNTFLTFACTNATHGLMVIVCIVPQHCSYLTYTVNIIIKYFHYLCCLHRHKAEFFFFPILFFPPIELTEPNEKSRTFSCLPLFVGWFWWVRFFFSLSLVFCCLLSRHFGEAANKSCIHTHFCAILKVHPSEPRDITPCDIYIYSVFIPWLNFQEHKVVLNWITNYLTPSKRFIQHTFM